MGWRLVTALALAHMYDVADSLIYPTLVPTPTKVLDNVVNAVAVAATSSTLDAAVTACAIAYDAVQSCASSPGLSDAPEATQLACLCCAATTVDLDEYYSSCADYLSLSYPQSSTAYSAYMEVASACHAEVPTCGVGAAASATTSTDDDSTETESHTDTPTRAGTGSLALTTTSPGRATVPPECTSLTDIISSCVSATPSLAATTVQDSDAASCVCYVTRGTTSTYTTEVDDLASECAPWAKTAEPTAYTAFSAFQSFCADYPPSSTDDTPSETTAATDSTDTTTFDSFTAPTTTRAASTTSSATPAPNQAAQVGAGGLLVWTAQMMTMVLSIFFLV